MQVRNDGGCWFEIYKIEDLAGALKKWNDWNITMEDDCEYSKGVSKNLFPIGEHDYGDLILLDLDNTSKFGRTKIVKYQHDDKPDLQAKNDLESYLFDNLELQQ